MTVTISGATGYLGRRIVDALLASGDRVELLSRRPKSESRPNTVVMQWNPNSGPPPAGVSDVFVHLAGEPVAQFWTAAAKERIRQSRVQGTRNVVDGFVGGFRKPSVFVCASAIGFYGDRGDEILTEASAAGSGFLPDVCVEWEREADRAAALGIRVVKVRTGIVLGPGGGALQKMLPVFRMGIGGTLGSGRQWMSWIHVDDIVGLFLHAIRQPVHGAMNGVGPAPVTNAEFTRALGSALHRPAVIPVPGFAVKLLTGEMAQVVLGSQRVLPAVAQATGYDFRFTRIDEALRAATV